MKRVALGRLPAQGLKDMGQAVTLVERVPVEQGVILVFKVNHEQQAKQEHHTVFINAGQVGFGVGFINSLAHDFKYRVFAGVAVNHGLEVFFHRQREVCGGGDGLLNGAGCARRCWLNIGVTAKEKGKQGEALCLLGWVFQSQQAL